MKFTVSSSEIQSMKETYIRHGKISTAYLQRKFKWTYQKSFHVKKYFEKTVLKFQEKIDHIEVA